MPTYESNGNGIYRKVSDEPVDKDVYRQNLPRDIKITARDKTIPGTFKVINGVNMGMTKPNFNRKSKSGSSLVSSLFDSLNEPHREEVGYSRQESHLRLEITDNVLLIVEQIYSTDSCTINRITRLRCRHVLGNKIASFTFSGTSVFLNIDKDYYNYYNFRDKELADYYSKHYVVIDMRNFGN